MTGTTTSIECDLCHDTYRAKDMGLQVVINYRPGSAGPAHAPLVADVCAYCLTKPIGDLSGYFWTTKPRHLACDEGGMCNHYPGDCPPANEAKTGGAA